MVRPLRLRRRRFGTWQKWTNGSTAATYQRDSWVGPVGAALKAPPFAMRGSMALRFLALAAVLMLAASARPVSREDGADAEEIIVPIDGKSWVDTPVLSRGREDGAQRERCATALSLRLPPHALQPQTRQPTF